LDLLIPLGPKDWAKTPIKEDYSFHPNQRQEKILTKIIKEPKLLKELFFKPSHFKVSSDESIAKISARN